MLCPAVEKKNRKKSIGAFKCTETNSGIKSLSCELHEWELIETTLYVLVLCSSQTGAWLVSDTWDEAGWTLMPSTICPMPCNDMWLSWRTSVVSVTSREVLSHVTRWDQAPLYICHFLLRPECLFLKRDIQLYAFLQCNDTKRNRRDKAV